MFDDESAPARTARHLLDKAFELQRRGALADAMRLYRESITHYATAEAHTFLGWTYSQIKLYEAAIEECQRAIALDPEFGNPYNDIGAYFIELDAWQEALPWLEKALAASRYASREYAYLNIGRVHEHFGRWLKAAESYHAAIELNGDYQPARWAYQRMLGKVN